MWFFWHWNPDQLRTIILTVLIFTLKYLSTAVWISSQALSPFDSPRKYNDIIFIIILFLWIVFVLLIRNIWNKRKYWGYISYINPLYAVILTQTAVSQRPAHAYTGYMLTAKLRIPTILYIIYIVILLYLCCIIDSSKTIYYGRLSKTCTVYDRFQSQV